MARTTDQALAQLLRFLPPRYQSIEAPLSGVAAAIRQGEIAWDDMATASTIGGATGSMLTLRAKGYGVNPSPDESADSIRSRIRNVEGQVTRPAILDAVNALLAEYTADLATMIERTDDGFLDYDCYLDHTRICDWHNSFVLVVPLVGDLVGGASYIDLGYLDHDLWLGASGEQHPVYDAIIALVRRIRAAGIRVTLAIDT